MKMILLQIDKTVDAVSTLSGSISEYGFMTITMSVFLIVVIFLFVGVNRRYNKMFDQLLVVNKKKSDSMDESITAINSSISGLIEKMTEVLTIVKENQEGLDEKAKHEQTYTGAMKIIRLYFNATKLEIIKNTNKIIEKNNITDTATVRRKISNIITGIQKKRAIDFMEFSYMGLRFSDVMPKIDINEGDIITTYIQDPKRNIDKFIGELDAIYNDALTEIEARFLSRRED